MRAAAAADIERNRAARFSPPPSPPSPPPSAAERERFLDSPALARSLALAVGGRAAAIVPARKAIARLTTHDSLTMGALGHADLMMLPGSVPSGVMISVTSRLVNCLMPLAMTAAPSAFSRASSASRLL